MNGKIQLIGDIEKGSLEELMSKALNEGFGYKVSIRPVLKNELLGFTEESTDECFVYLFGKIDGTNAPDRIIIQGPKEEEYLWSEYKIIK